MKEYSAANVSFTVSQVEVQSPEEILERSAEVAAGAGQRYAPRASTTSAR
ncbi:MAG: hypothetical protein MZV63_46730 [Marinilabiliales bacterium]|nr:hypothetical protein [Marinilabiliales bacterium]